MTTLRDYTKDVEIWGPRIDPLTDSDGPLREET